MGFLQRGFAYGNKKGFAIWRVGAALTFTMKIIGVLLGGGGRIADQTADLTEFLPTLQGGGGTIADQTATMMTTTVILSLGSYP